MRLSFGDFVLDTDTRELRRGSQPLHLSTKAFHLLEVLAAKRPSAVSKADLHERLWPDTFVVEKNLVNLISEIRDALGDNPSEPQFIRTVHRFGTPFATPWRSLMGNGLPGSASSGPKGTRRSTKANT